MAGNKVKETLALAVRESLNVDDRIFGGYVRDFIAGEDYNDLDIFFKSQENFNLWAGRLRDKGYRLRLDREFTAPPYTSDVEHERYILSKDNVEVKIDALRNSDPASKNTSPYTKEKADIDINQLTVDKYGKIGALFDISASAAQNNIKKRQYRVLNADKTRTEKLTKKGYNQMSTSSVSTKSNMNLDIFSRLKENAKEAAYSSAAKQGCAGVKKALLASLASAGKDNATIQSVKDILDSTVGDMFVYGVLSMALINLPGIKEDARAQKLADHMQVNGMADGMNAIFEIFSSAVMPAIQSSLSGLNSALDKAEGVTTPAAKVEEKVLETVKIAATA